MPSSLEAFLLEQLRTLAPDGLPKEWFQKSPAREIPLSPSKIVPTGASPLGEAQTAIKEAYCTEALDPTERNEYAELNIEELRALALGCPKCRLCEERTKVVFGTGNISEPPIVFVGEGPGAEEDRSGEPFVGKAGQLLTAAITKGLGLRREDVYIANVVKCRPPQNRAPLPDEVAACSPYLYRQLELIRPKIIVTLGQPAQLALSGVNLGITKLRGKWQTWRGIPLMPTFHPAYILRNPAAKKDFWADLQSVMAKLAETEPAS